MSARRLFPRLIAASLMVVYSYGAGVVPKGRHIHRENNFTTILMHVDTICAFAWTLQYASSRSVFPNRIRFEGNLMRMDEIMWRILRRNNP